ncbi:unnamed protein product [Urochloa humidicola]
MTITRGQMHKFYRSKLVRNSRRVVYSSNLMRADSDRSKQTMREKAQPVHDYYMMTVDASKLIKRRRGRGLIKFTDGEPAATTEEASVAA